MTVISRVLLITADLIVIVVTWSALVTGRTVHPGFKGRKHMKLTYVMLEKSLIYVVWVPVPLLANHTLTKKMYDFLGSWSR